MKKRLVAGILAVVMSITCLAGFGSMEAKAAEEKKDEYTLPDGELFTVDGFYEISVGDTADFEAGNLYKNGEQVKEGEAEYITAVLGTLGEDGVVNVLDEPNPIPEDIFGETLVGVLWYKMASGDLVTARICSKFPVTYGVSENAYTVGKNGENSVVIFTVWGGKSIKFVDKVTVGGKEYAVTAVSERAISQYSKERLTAVTMPASITEIGESAFEGAKKLKNITINGKLTYVGENAFKGINSKAVFKIKANKKNFNKMVKMIKKAGAPKKATFKRVK